MLNSSFYYDESSLQPLFGRAVCVILNDGTRHTGILTSCSPSSIILNGERTARPVKRSRKSKAQADISTLQQEVEPQHSGYWGELNFGPVMEVSSVKAVIPLAPVREVFPI